MTQREWTTVIYCAAAAGLVAIGAILFRWLANTDLIRVLFAGFGAAVLALIASFAVVDAFRRTVVRTGKPGAGSVGGSRQRRVKDQQVLPGAGRQLKGVDLRGAHLIDARLAASDLVDARLDGANLSYAFLDRALLSGACLVDAVLEGASLNFADLRHADLRRADLTRAQLSGADLSNAQLHGAILREANLEGATLVDADLRRVELAGSSLEGTKIRGADFRGVASPTKQLPAEQIEDVATNAQPGFFKSLIATGRDAKGRVTRQRG
jgi:hypothetical protein